ncbi:MAG: hypothetical protein JXA11_07670 [Phycisphaerae bacterium]|nr:hypothetical protein [Phycisphaerae bacterium]
MPNLNSKEKNVLSDCRTAPLNTVVKNVVQKGQPALKLLSQAATCDYCDWQENKEKDIDVFVQHLTKARTAAKLIILSARLAAQEGKQTDAVDAFVTAIKLGRDSSTDGPILSFLFSISIETLAIETLAEILPSLDKKHISLLMKKLNALKAAPTLTSAFENELVFLEKKKDDPQYTLVVKHLKTYTKIAELPPDEFKRRAKQMPKTDLGFARANYLYAAHKTKWAMLRAAMLFFLEGRQGMESVQDPYGKGPFAFKKTPKGFDLVGQLKDKNKPVILSVGI